jgi:transcriptional regulator with XRE-family HTH domain
MINLGQRIRRERQTKGWSLKKLSNLIGVSIMTLQRIETGKVSPSVDLLTEIAYQLHLPVTEFVADKNPTFIHLKTKDLPLEQRGPRSRKALFPQGLVTEDLSVWLYQLDPGGVIDWASNMRFEGAYLMEGQIELEFDDRKVRLQAGETIYFDARFRQRVKTNLGAKGIAVLKG